MKSFATHLPFGVLLRLGRGFVVLALFLSIGAHWAALQSVAWASMLVGYSQHVSVAKAIAQTFDGKHPCALCKQIAAGQSAPRKDAPLIVKVKPDLICTKRTIVLCPPVREIDFCELRLKESARFYSPPTPPPRLELA